MLRVKNSKAISAVPVLAVAGAMLLLCACNTAPSSPAPLPVDPYAAYKESRPRSILVMPPVNRSPDTMAQATFLSTATIPLAESGYYVIPVALSQEMFRQNGVTIAEEANAISFGRLYEIFGADAALYITVSRYGVRFVLVNSIVEAEASARLIDLKTGEELWSGKSRAELKSNNSNSGDLLTAIIGAALDQISNTISDRAYDMGKTVNNKMLSAGYKNSILYGPYHPKFGTE